MKISLPNEEKSPVGKLFQPCHSLEGNEKGEYAMDLIHLFRLIFEYDKSHIQVLRITNIEDYH